MYASRLPCSPLGVPPVEAPWIRCQIAVMRAHRVEVAVGDEHGCRAPSRRRRPRLSSPSSASARKRSAQTTSLASSRVACAASCSPAADGVAGRGRRLERLPEPLHAAHTQLQRLDRVLVRRGQRARVGRSRCARCTPCCCCEMRPASSLLQLGLLQSRVSSAASPGPRRSSSRSEPTSPISVM